MFRPTNLGKKPGNNTVKAKPKPNFSAMHKFSSSTSTTTGDASAGLGSSDTAAPPSVKAQKRGFEDWLANDEEDFLYERPRQDRKKSKKNFHNKKSKNTQQQQTWSYDDIYDPSVPVNIAQYAKSEAAFQSKERWKMRLFAANKKERMRLGQTAKGMWRRSVSRSAMLTSAVRPATKDFAAPAPANSMFAPPPELSSFNDDRPQSSGSSTYRRHDSDQDYDDMPRATFGKPSFAPPASLAPTVVNLNREETADEAYARRLALSSEGAARPVAPSLPAPVIPQKTATPDELEKRAKAAQQIAALKAKMAAKSVTSAPSPLPASEPSPVPAPAVAPASVPASASLPAAQQAFVSAAAPIPNYTQEDLDTLQAVLKQPDVPERNPSPEVSIATSLTGVASSKGPIPEGSVLPSGFAPTISGAPTYNYGFPGIAPHMDSRIATQAPPTPPPQQAEPSSSSAPAEPEEPSRRPGQDGFAERLLKKMGWEKGQGLGASNDGITTAIVMKADKRKRVPGAKSGGAPLPAMGKIVGGNKKKQSTDLPAEEDTPHGNMSPVIKLSGMLKGLDVDAEIRDNNLMQEIGDHMGEMFGKVERLFIWRESEGGAEDVFVRFTSELSALRAVKGMHGEEFAGNEVRGRFFDGGRFERGEYE